MGITEAEYHEIAKRAGMKLRNGSKAVPPLLDGLDIVLVPNKTNFQVKQSTDEAKLNKTEREYFAYVKRLGHQWVGCQSITLKIGDDCRFTPDFGVLTSDGKLQCHEVKGFWRDDAKVKIKVAARQFSFIEFIVVQKNKQGWSFESVKP